MAYRTHKSLIITLLIALLAISALPTQAGDPVRDYAALIDSATLEAHIRALAVDIGARPAGSEAEAQAAEYIAAQLAAWGYDVQTQPVAASTPGENPSLNVIATKSATVPDEATRTIVIGAHMDSVTAGTGADDNASGVAVILATAEALAGLDTRMDIVFAVFGAEETGLNGSRAFLDALDPQGREAILVMFNVDTVGIGDFAYVYAGARTEPEFMPGPTWARDLALDVAADLGHDLRTTPPESWDGFTGPWSDHAPFVEHDIPIAYFERWNWDAGSDPAWGVETADAGDVLHTARDQFENVDSALAEPIAEILTATVALLATGQGYP